MLSELGMWGLTVLATGVATLAPLAFPPIREFVGRYVAAFMQHHFNEKIEKLRSELRLSEAKFSADLSAKEQQLKSLTEAALSLRSNKQSALDVRRLQAVEKLWAAKIAADGMKLAANLVSRLNLEELHKSAEKKDTKIKLFAETLTELTGLNLPKDMQHASAVSEQPFLAPKIWMLFSAYQGVIIQSVFHLQMLRFEVTQFMKKEDGLKPLMLLALPEYKAYIEKHGFSGYYHLLDRLEEKLLLAILETLDGKDADDATLRRTAEIIAAARAVHVEMNPEIPENLRGPEIPDPATV